PTRAGWGTNGYGQSSPPTGMGTLTAITPGLFHTSAMRSDGRTACWGDNSYGQGTPLTATVNQISAGDNDVCAIRSDNTAACWGSNSDAQSTPPGPWGPITSISA